MNDGRGSLRQHLIEYYLPFYYMLSLYGDIFIIGLGNAILIVLAFTRIKHGKIPIRRDLKIYFGFIVWIVLRDVIKTIVIGSMTPAINAVEYIVLFMSFFLIETNAFDEDRLYKTWKIAGVIYSIGLLYHIIQIYILGHPIHPISIIPGYTLGGSGLLLYRPCSFFSEPAAFASAMLPLVFLAIKRKEYSVAILASIVIIASTSTVGIVLLAVLWLYTVTVSEIRLRTKIFISIFLVGVMMYLFTSPIFLASFEKLSGVISGEGTFGTRIVVGFGVISSMDLWQWVFGSNTIDVSNFVSMHLSQLSGNRAVMSYFYAGRLFLNSFTALIFNYGIIGLILYFNTILKRFQKSEYRAKPLLLMHVVSLFGQSTMLNSLFFQMIILLSFYDVTRVENDGKY